jgi:hypothetical protein
LLYNIDFEVAFDKVRSFLYGDNEPLKQIGINITDAALSAYSLSRGIADYDSLSENQKRTIRYNYLLSSIGGD